MLREMNSLHVQPNALAIWGLGQMGVALQTAEAVVYIDPYLSNSVEEMAGAWWKRAFVPPIRPEAISNAKYIFITHEHLDHLDPQTLRAMRKLSPEVRFVTTQWCEKPLRDLGVIEPYILTPSALEPYNLPEISLRVTPVPAAHYELTFDVRKGYRWLGFLIEWNGVTFYHAGDTVIYPNYLETLKSLPKIDVALLPINGRDWVRERRDVVGNLHPLEAAHLASELGIDTVLIGHNDMFPNNALPMGEVFQAFATHAPRQKLKYLQPSELLYYVKL